MSNFVKNQYFRQDHQFSLFCQFFVKNEILWSLGIVLSVATLLGDVGTFVILICVVSFFCHEYLSEGSFENQSVSGNIIMNKSLVPYFLIHCVDTFLIFFNACSYGLYDLG